MTIQNRQDNLIAVVQPCIEGLGSEFVGLEVVSDARSSVLRVYADNEGGISVGQLETISRQLSRVLDLECPGMEHYRLELSSPGLDRPMFTLEHYQRSVGKLVKIRLSVPDDGRRNFQGVIESVSPEGKIVLQLDEGNIQLSFSAIEKGRWVPEFKSAKKTEAER